MQDNMTAYKLGRLPGQPDQGDGINSYRDTSAATLSTNSENCPTIGVEFYQPPAVSYEAQGGF